MAHDQIPPLDEAGVIELVDPPVEVLDGMRLLPAPGHSLGQVAVELGEAALYLADAVIDELHAEHPDWTMEFDADPLVAIETRRRLLARAADADLIVARVTPCRAGARRTHRRRIPARRMRAQDAAAVMACLGCLSGR